ncbi:MAG: DUF4259 domain-containing protein [Pseudomonadota bacterium]
MGSWSAGSFGNDTALDFAGGLKSFGAVLQTISEVSETAAEMDADTASIALAACDLIAAGIGRPPGDLPELPDEVDLQAAEVPAEILDSAKRLVARVRKNSELAELWAEEDAEEWLSELDALVVRLSPSLPYDPPEKPKQPELPDDFLGYCYVCYGMVTERDGLLFEHRVEGGGTLSTHPHRKCIEERIGGPGPFWHPDGAPTEVARRKLMEDMGYEF